VEITANKRQNKSHTVQKRWTLQQAHHFKHTNLNNINLHRRFHEENKVEELLDI
jgi:hypothetical protein